MSEIVKLENEGHIASMSLPAGFVAGEVDREDNYLEFTTGAVGGPRICYWNRPFFAAPSDLENIEKVLDKNPHELKEDEVLDMLPLMAPGRWAYNGNFNRISYRTEEIAGRKVLVGELKFNDQDKKSYVVFANPCAEHGAVEIIWFEAPSKAFDQYKQAAVDAIQSISWG